MNFILFYSLFTCISLQTSGTSSTKKHAYQIDEFIKQLMISEKFDELADIIADKAAHKIKNMDSQGINSLRQGRDENLTNHPQPEDHENIKNNKYHNKPNRYREINEKDTRSSETNYDREKNIEKPSKPSEKKSQAHKNTKSHSQNEEKESHSQNEEKYPVKKFGKLDMDAFLKKHMTSKELELNFKHLKAELEKHRFNIKGNKQNAKNEYDEDKRNEFIDNNRAVKKHQDESNKNENTSLEISNRQRPINEDSREFFSSIENVGHEPTLHNTRDKKKDDMNSRENKSSNDSVKEEEKGSKFKDHNQKHDPRNDEQTNNSKNLQKSMEDDTKELIDEVFQEVSEELKGPHHSSKEIVQDGTIRALSDRSKESFSQRHGKRNTEKRVKVENGKQYTFQSSSEYAEYHEKVAREKGFYL